MNNRTASLKDQLWLVVLAVIAISFYLVKYLSYGSTPGVNPGEPLGWWNWFDQGQYLESARALRHWDFTAGKHLYPIGYSILGALFYRKLPLHPFLIPNMVIFLLILLFLYMIYRKYLSSPESIILAGSLFVFHFEIMENLIIPWTVIPSTLLLTIAVYVTVIRDIDSRTFKLAGILAGVSFFFRPGDWIFYIPLTAFTFLSLKGRSARLKGLLTFLAYLISFIVLAAAVNKFIYGAYFRTPYNALSADIGFSLYNVFIKGYSILISAATIYNSKDPMMLNRFPWLLILLPGAVYAVKVYGPRVYGLIISIVLTYVFYLAYNDFDAQVIFAMKALRYFTWTFPFLWLFSYLTIRKAWSVMSKKAFVTMLVAPALILSLITLNVRRVDAQLERTAHYDDLTISRMQEGSTVRLIYLQDFPKEKYGNRNVYPQIVLDGIKLQHFRDYRGIYRSDGVVLLLHKPAHPSVVGIGWEGIDATDRARVTSMELYDAGIGLNNPMRHPLWNRHSPLTAPSFAFAEHALNNLSKGENVNVTFATSDAELSRKDKVVGSLTDARIISQDTVLLGGGSNRIELDLHNKEYGLGFWVCPDDKQVTYADLLSNHKSGFIGYAIEQNGSSAPQFNLGIGNGKEWRAVQNLAIQPLAWNLVVVNMLPGGIELFTYSNKLSRYAIDERPFISDEMPLFIGNWHAKDRPFHGRVSTITVSGAPFTPKEIDSLARNKPSLECRSGI